MIRVRQVKVQIEKNNNEEIKRQAALKLKISPNKIETLEIKKQSLDARKKDKLSYVYEIDVKCKNENLIIKKNKTNDIFITPQEIYQFSTMGTKKLPSKPVIIGSGPAGLFTAYMLAQHGYQPIIMERGEKIEDRVKRVDEFWETGDLKVNSNVQFGEGGAGTFSDGKLNTLVKDKEFRMKKVFEIFVKHGAPKEIMYINKPHIGTDILRKVIINMRNEIIKMGGVFHYNTCFTNIIIGNNILKAIEINHKDIIACDILVLAIGHSARDTFEMLYDKKISMSPKPFAVGIRIQHPQKMINKAQYGVEESKYLPVASYKLTYKATNGRGVYSFCMCPGGYVVNASSEQKRLAINGMSNYKRDSANANSALVVTITPKDFGLNPLDGMQYQRKLEEKAYQIGMGKIPVQLLGDFKQNKNSKEFKETKPIFKGNYKFANLNDILPNYVCNALKEGINFFDKKIKGYARDDAILAAIESRTSSPVRIQRDENFLSNIEGIYPCGEGAGYAGGITTSAIDGIKVAEAIAKKYKND